MITEFELLNEVAAGSFLRSRDTNNRSEFDAVLRLVRHVEQCGYVLEVHRTLCMETGRVETIEVLRLSELGALRLADIRGDEPQPAIAGLQLAHVDYRS